MRRSRELDENGEFFPFGRPPASAWVAAGAVAFALFVLGGFIKTHRQLELLREESRREIRELRAQLDLLRGRDAPAAARRSTERRVEPLPAASGLRDEFRESQPAAAARVPARPARAEPAPPEAPAESVRSGFSLELRRSPQPPAESVQEPLRVISVSQKRLMIDGGRNAGLSGGARLELSRNGRWIGDLRITDVYDSMAACEILHAALPPRPGDLARMP